MKTYEALIEDITDINRQLERFWSSSHGWASQDAAALLQISRLDWQVALSSSLSNWIHLDDARQGDLILAWANLGALIEGSLKLFLSVYIHDYQSNIDTGKTPEKNSKSKNFFDQFIDKKGSVKTPDIVELEKLIQFFEKMKILDEKQIEFLKFVQAKRNAIHAYKSRDIGNFEDFYFSLQEYMDLLSELKFRLPYPE